MPERHVACPALAINVHPKTLCNDFWHRSAMRQLRGFFRIPARIFLALATFLWYRIRHHSCDVGLPDKCSPNRTEQIQFLLSSFIPV